MLKHQSFSSNLCHSTHLNQNELIFGRACNLNPSPLSRLLQPCNKALYKPCPHPQLNQVVCPGQISLTYV